ncbi:MAG: LON peptidase substrate-binding domain-containing protein, partial [Planctomycetota bacterium]
MPRGSGSRDAGAAQGTEHPAVHLISTVVFPHDVVSLHLPEENPAARLLPDVEETTVVALFGKRGALPPRRLEDVRRIGVLCRVAQSMRMPDGGLQVVFQGLERTRIRSLRADGDDLRVVVESLGPEKESTGTDPRVLEVLDLVTEFLSRDGTHPEHLDQVLRLNLRGPGRFADLAAASLHLPLAVKRDVVATPDPGQRLTLLAAALEEEVQRCLFETSVHERVRDRLDRRQKEQYVRMQIKALREEIGDERSPDEEAD